MLPLRDLTQVKENSPSILASHHALPGQIRFNPADEQVMVMVLTLTVYGEALIYLHTRETQYLDPNTDPCQKSNPNHQLE